MVIIIIYYYYYCCSSCRGDFCRDEEFDKYLKQVTDEGLKCLNDSLGRLQSLPPLDFVTTHFATGRNTVGKGVQAGVGSPNTGVGVPNAMEMPPINLPKLRIGPITGKHLPAASKGALGSQKSTATLVAGEADDTPMSHHSRYGY